MKNFFKKITTITFILLLTTKSFSQSKFLLEQNFKDFVPITAIEFDLPIVIADKVGTFETLTAKELATDKLKLQKFLNDFSVYVTIERVNQFGKIEYAPAGATIERGSYNIIVDFVKLNTVNLNLKDGSCGGFGKVGVGLRLKANIESKRSGLNVGNLFGLALAAQQRKISGTLSFDVIGIDSKDVVNMIPLPTEISTSSIANALQAMAALKSKLDDPETRLHPKLLAIKLNGNNNCAIDLLIKKITEEQLTKTIQVQQD